MGKVINMRIIQLIFTIACLLIPSLMMAQKTRNNNAASVTPAISTVERVKPTIMVIPYTSQGDDIRTVVEKDVNKRIVLNKIRESFDGAGYTTIDFIARLKAISNNTVFMDGSQADIKNTIIENSGADIYVEAEIVTGQAGSVKVLLTGYDTATGASLSNVTGESGVFPGLNDIGRLAQTAIENCRNQFLSTLQSKFDDMKENGRSIIVNISFDEGSSYTMESVVGSQGLQLSDEIELWMDEHAYKNNYHIQGTTSTLMILDDVRIPVIDSSTGKNYNVNKFSMEFFKYMRRLGINIQRNTKGNTLYIKIR